MVCDLSGSPRTVWCFRVVSQTEDKCVLKKAAQLPVTYLRKAFVFIAGEYISIACVKMFLRVFMISLRQKLK